MSTFHRRHFYHRLNMATTTSSSLSFPLRPALLVRPSLSAPHLPVSLALSSICLARSLLCPFLALFHSPWALVRLAPAPFYLFIHFRPHPPLLAVSKIPTNILIKQ